MKEQKQKRQCQKLCPMEIMRQATKCGSVKAIHGCSTFLSGQLTNNKKHAQFHSTRKDHTLSHNL